MAKILNLDDIKSLPDVPTKTIDIPQWNVSIKVKGISKKMQIELGRLINGKETDAFDYQKALLKASVVEPELTDEAIDELYNKDATVIDMIFAELNNINGVGSEIESALAEDFKSES
jgi:hypothetical protein